MLDNPIAKGLLRADATGLAFHILMELDSKSSASHGVKVDVLQGFLKPSPKGSVILSISLFYFIACPVKLL
jgi:hypothetical protein